MASEILCAVLSFSGKLDPRLVADRLAGAGTEFVAAFRNEAGETVVLVSVAMARAGQAAAVRFVAEQRATFGDDLIGASAGAAVSRTINIPQ